MSTTDARIPLEFDANAATMDARLREAVEGEAFAKRVGCFYLHAMMRRKLYLVLGYADTYHYAEEVLELDARRVRERIQLGEALSNLEVVDRAFLDGELSWSKVMILMPVIQKDTQVAWVDWAKTVPCRTLKDEVAGCEKGDLPGEGNNYGLVHPKINFTAALTDDDLEWIERARSQLSKDGEPLSDRDLLLALAQRHVLESGGHPPREELEAAPCFERPEPLPYEERNHEDVPDWMEHSIQVRDKARCRCCDRDHDLQTHHIVFRNRGGINDPNNLLRLCQTCHSNVHRGYLRITGWANREVKYEFASGQVLTRQSPTPMKDEIMNLTR